MNDQSITPEIEAVIKDNTQLGVTGSLILTGITGGMGLGFYATGVLTAHYTLLVVAAAIGSNLQVNRLNVSLFSRSLRQRDIADLAKVHQRVAIGLALLAALAMVFSLLWSGSPTPSGLEKTLVDLVDMLAAVSLTSAFLVRKPDHALLTKAEKYLKRLTGTHRPD